MSIFGNIMNKIFRRQPTSGGAAAPGTPSSGTAAAGAAPAAPSASGATGTNAPQAPQAAPQPVPAPGTAAASGPPASAPAAPAQPVDVEAVLTQLAAQKGQTLNWRTSIVDLMKLLDLDSSLAERKELARELGYSGDMNDSASMNIWLHKQVMRKLADNGGKVPAELKD